MSKQIALLAVITLFLGACKKETTVLAPNAPEGATWLYRGAFTSGPYGTTSGVVKIFSVNNNLSLELDSFAVNNGPDLHVYLSKEVQPINFIDLGRLSNNSGKQTYAISGMPNFAQYKYALIHCQQYDHLFGSAILIMR